MEKPLIVQGAAGSGKTTIALHRLAYLLYTYSDTFDSEDFMIIGPNNLFLDYISNVLPELGADNIKQSTYVDFMFELIGDKYKVTDSNKKLNELIRTDSKALKVNEKEMIIKSSKLKNSMEMKNLLDSFINNVEKRVLPDEDYTIEGFPILSSSEISDLYYESYGYQPILKRIESIKKYLKGYTKNSIKDILKEINHKYTEELRLLREDPEDSPEKKLKMIGLMEEREGTLKKAEKNAKKAADKFIKKFKTNNLLGFYKEFISNLDEYYSEDINLGKYISKETKKLINKKTLEIEDLASVVYLKDRFFGINENLDIKVAVIDEAQDFSEFQFFVLHRVLDTERFTILGDLSQGIHMYRAVENWDYVKDSIFNEDVNYLTLEQSYRTTIEIMNLANEVLSQTDTSQLIKAKPVVRHGEDPVIQELREDKKITSNIIKQLYKWDNDSLTTVAIVTKSNEEAKKIFCEITALNKSLDIELVDENSEHFNHKILVIPAHLSKGLEFDGVIITTLNEDYTFETLDTKLLYVAMTRAMHRLAIYCKKDSIPHIKDKNTGKIAV
ncbi:MAG: 3'-5' exonuclease [Bacillota bacterium]|nr:3'-5' exonuclease [Bacillota bacterium]